ncbi:MAG: transaldolase family protein [Eubacteriales bacterium]|nr:transaldolase family protein [Eubacteriales bacterium]
MEFFVDIADIESVRSVAEYYPIDGFTTNPNILTKGAHTLEENMRSYKEYIDETGLKVFVQVTAKDAEGMVSQAVKLKEYFGDNLVVKLPAVKEGYKALKECKKLGIEICITVIHSVLQALMAAKGGADYAAPYVSHIDNIGADGIREVEEMVKVFDRFGYKCKVLGASFRTADQIEKLAAVGCHAVTITPQFFDLLIEHPSTDVSLNGFYRVWEDTYQDKQITDAL